jgi:hypothetical protein
MGDASKMKDLTKLIREMPQYQKDLKKYNTNFRLAEDCMREQERIRLLCKIEQVGQAVYCLRFTVPSANPGTLLQIFSQSQDPGSWILMLKLNIYEFGICWENQ